MERVDLTLPTHNDSAYTVREILDAALGEGPQKSTSSKLRKKADQLRKQRHITQSMKRLEQHLGLRPSTDTQTTRTLLHPQAEVDGEQVGSVPCAAGDLTLEPAPFPMDQAVVFVAVDVEAYERDTSIVLEVGIATLDVRELAGIAPGPAGAAWSAKIRSRHLLVAEHMGFKNGDRVASCPDRFRFGSSERVNRDDVRWTLYEHFQHLTLDIMDVDPVQPREYVLVGHELGADLRMLRHLQFDARMIPTLVGVQDTTLLDRFRHGSPNARSLEKVLVNHGIEARDQHNAGNDATYALQAMLAMALATASDRRDPSARERRRAGMVQEATAAAVEAFRQVLRYGEGWDTDSGEEDGGGRPQHPGLECRTSCHVTVANKPTCSLCIRHAP